ncbi:unnamed protein product, partial [Onchocerca flexuosa]|uniref:F-box/LRR-repeat protein n=1 Tax=Onchocerca flexuosa TaxID=387005 RepID=A0A183HW12_9BILA
VSSFVYFQTSQYLRKLCIDCSVPLSSAKVNALFDICLPNVIHLDLGLFKEMNTTLLKKLSDCFPNVETLHMEELFRRSTDRNGEEWNKVVEMLFGDESIFPKMQNFFMGIVDIFQTKLSACKRPLNLLYTDIGVYRMK